MRGVCRSQAADPGGPRARSRAARPESGWSCAARASSPRPSIQFSASHAVCRRRGTAPGVPPLAPRGRGTRALVRRSRRTGRPRRVGRRAGLVRHCRSRGARRRQELGHRSGARPAPVHPHRRPRHGRIDAGDLGRSHRSAAVCGWVRTVARWQLIDTALLLASVRRFVWLRRTAARSGWCARGRRRHPVGGCRYTATVLSRSRPGADDTAMGRAVGAAPSRAVSALRVGVSMARLSADGGSAAHPD